MAVPTFVGYSVAYQASGSSISLTPHASTASGDIIINYVMSKYAFPTTPTTITASTNGGTKISQHGAGNFLTLATFWQRVSGSPPATMSYTHGTSACPLGFVTASFRGCVASGTPYDFYKNQAIASSSTWYVRSGTTVGADRLIVTGQIADTASMFYNNGTYFSSIAQGAIGSGFYGALLSYSDLVAGASPTDSGSMFSATYRMGTTLALAPPAVTGYANKVNGVASANIGKVNNVATADIGNVIGV